jgi:FkbM family methyltransferase
VTDAAEPRTPASALKRVSDLIARARKAPKRAAGEDPRAIPLVTIAGHLPPDPVIVEAGAHVGRDTVRMAHLWPGGRIHAFEPLPKVFDMLRRNTRGLPNVLTYRLALGPASGTAALYVSGGSSDGSSSLLPPKKHLDYHPEVSFEERLDVETITLDDWAARESIPRVDLLWLDLQGIEPLVLRSGERTLAGASAVHTEVNLVENYEGAILYGELRSWLAERGFEVAAEDLRWEDGGDVLFLRTTA